MRAAGLSDEKILEIFEMRMGLDAESGTLDDGIENLGEVGLNASKFKLQSDFVKVTSVGDVFDKQYQITCVFYMGANPALPVFWHEGQTEQGASRAR